MSLVTITHRQGIAWLTLARPDRANALTAEMLDDLQDALDRLSDARALVLTAEGRSFCTGGDVGRLAAEVDAGHGRAYAQRLVGGLHAAVRRLAGLDIPVLARVQGALTGGALGLVLAADLVVMTPDAFVQPWYGRIGFAPDGGWTRALASRIGAHRARALHLLNGRLTANEALTLGLAQAVSDAPDDVIAGWLDALARQDAASLAVTKRLLADDLSASLDAELAAFLDLIEQPETRVRMARFLARAQG